MRLQQLIATIALWFLPMMASPGAEYVLRPIPTRQQLPVASIHTLLQDQEGFMWYATRGGGLCRDNGYHIDVFRSDRLHPTLMGRSNHIKDIAETKGHIIFSTLDGLYALDKHDCSITLIDKELEGKTVEPVLAASDGTIWASANQRIYHYDGQFRRLGVYDSQWQGTATYPCRMMEDSRGNIWVSQWQGGIICFDKHSNRFVEQYWSEGLTPVNMVEDKKNGCYWVGTWGGGIVKYCPTEHLVELQAATTGGGDLAQQVIYMLKSPDKSRLFASTMNGLKAYDVVGGLLVELDMSGILPPGLAMTDYMTLDRDGNLWVAGFPPHMFILSPLLPTFTKISPEAQGRLEGAGKTIVWNSVSDGDYIWVGMDRLSLSLYHRPTRTYSYPVGTTINSYSDVNHSGFIKCKNQKAIWNYVGRDVYRLRHELMTIKAEHIATATDEINCLYDAGNGNLYIGHQRGIDVLDITTGRLRPMTIASTSVEDIVRGDDGTLYYCSGDRGLMALSPDGKEQVISDIGEFTSIAKDGQGTLWAGDQQGDLLHYDPIKHEAMIDERGSDLDGNYIRRIAIDSIDHLWILTDMQIKEYDPASGNYRILTADDQEIGFDFFYSVSVDGNIVRVDGAGGILELKPLQGLEARKTIAKPIVTSISVDGEETILGVGGSSIDINADAVNLELQFSTLNHPNASKVFYAYRLDGIDTQWHYLPQGTNKATFVQLPKGKHVVQIMATDENGNWGEPVNAIALNRLPAWYETWWAYVCYLLLAAGAIAAALHYYLKRQRDKQNKIMEEQLTEMKFRFFTNISHELRTPLTLIITPLQSLRRRLNEVNKDVIANNLATIDHNAGRLQEMINRLLDFRKLELGNMQLDLASGDFNEFVATMCESFQPLSREKNIGLGCAIPNKSLYMNFDRTKMQHIVSNLLSNAFKFTDQGGNIAVSVTEVKEEKKVKLQVSDTGCGIPPSDLPHIFERYFQSREGKDPAVTGTGIGLNMVKELTEMHGGTVSVESKLDKGTTFTVTLPTDLAAQVDTAPLMVETGDETPRNGDTATILVVDDNDEFRQFLVGELSDSYNILQASNGEQALQLAGDHDIDMIISDVMMPQMDGMELCRRIKQDESTSHMMMILLTARTAEQVKIEGFKMGADDYLSKPFNMEMLQLRISHLLELRKKRTQEFQRGEEVNVEEVALNELDQKFLNRALAAVEKNLDNAGYDIEAFASDVCMSRSTLYRKLMSLTGQKPSEFIRTIRLKHAARLLKERKLSISEISDMCGFSSTSYFYRCFKKQYGVQPGNY